MVSESLRRISPLGTDPICKLANWERDRARLHKPDNLIHALLLVIG